ncbi:MAG: acyltransferase family protein [Proteobacteria bacterium]|nr:acyltransferase family protein [Pseudomonadota bacterium]
MPLPSIYCVHSVLVPLFRDIRAAWRLIHVVWLVLRGIATVRICFPRWGAVQQRAMKQAWSRRLVEVLGVRIDPCDVQLPASTLIVCNHISWLDVFVMNALTPTTFVCKDEVKDWPALGWLVEHSGTLFIERGSRAAAARSAQAMTMRLTGGERIAVFPEGTTTQGSSMLPFRAALFQAAIDAQVSVQPASLRYRDATGARSHAPAYDGDLSFGQSMLNIVRASGIHAEIRFLEALAPTCGRRELARLSEAAITRDLGFMPIPEEQILDDELAAAPDAGSPLPADAARAA